MPTLTIEGQRVTVDESFLSLPPEQQNATVDQIARELDIASEGGDQSGQDMASEMPEAAGQGGGIMDAIGQFGERFNRGLYGMANLPTSIANAGASIIGSDYRFKRPLEAAAPGIDQAIMDVPEAQSAGERLAGTVGEFMGANALPGMGMLAAAPRIAAATQGATGLAGQSVNRMASGIASAPGTAAAGEALSAAGSGVGASMAEDAGPNAQLLAATAGGMLAPAALAVTPTNLARKAVTGAAKRLAPDAIAKQQRQQIVRGIRENLTPDGRRAIDDTLAVQEMAPDYRPSVAEATENPAFIATQREFEAGLSGADLDNAMRRYGQNEAAIANAVRSQGPQSPLGIDDAFQTGRNRLRNIGSKLDAQTAGLDRRQQAIGNSLQAGQRQRELGASIREDLISRRGSTKEEMGITAREFGLNDSSPRYDFRQARQRLVQAVASRSALSDRSALPANILDDIRAAPDAVSIDDLMTLRTRIADDIRESSRTPSGEKRVPYLESLKTELDAVTDQVLRSAGDDDIADNLREFRRLYLEDYIKPFEQGAAAKSLKTDSSGAYVVRDEQVAKEFFAGWNQTAADQFRRVFPNSSSANAAMEAAALDDLHSVAIRDGVVSPNLVEAWARKNGGVLRDFPALAKKVRNVEGALKDIAARRATLAARKKAAESSILARELSRIDNATTTPEAVIQQATRNPARMDRLMRGLRSQSAKQAVAREVWDMALDAPNPTDFIRANPAIAKALGPNYQSAWRLARAIEKNKLVPRPAGRAMDTNPVASVEGLLGTGLNQISSRVFAVKSGRTSARYALSDIAGRAFRSMTARQARETLQQALYDPAIARDLANAIEAPQLATPQAMKRLYTFLVTNGLAVDDEDEVMR